MADTPTDDLFQGRRPTSHERKSGQVWDASYQDGPAPWDIGKPQPAFARLASEGGITGPLLDAGCGTGENSLLFAALGLPVLGVDVAQTAIAIARKKAAERGVECEFAVADALRLDRLGRQFKTVLDSGLFHTFEDEEWPAYVASLASVTERSGTLHLLAFSDDGPEIGPHPISRAELEAPFHSSSGWKIAAIERAHIHTRIHDNPVSAWFATIKRI
jgi:SAM-dependent methyltransferase